MQAMIIGSGPAGISAALYLKRAGIDVTILAKDGSALLKTEQMENYYGFDEPISGKELYCRGIAGAKLLRRIYGRFSCKGERRGISGGRSSSCNRCVQKSAQYSGTSGA